MDFPLEKIWREMKPNNEARALIETLRWEAWVKQALSMLKRWKILTLVYRLKWEHSCLGFTRISGVSEMREPQFSIHSKAHAFIWSFKRKIWFGDGFDHILCCITLLLPIWVSNYRIFCKREGCKFALSKKEIVSSYPHRYSFFLTCNVKHVLHTKWKSICHYRLSYSSSPTTLPAITV